MATADGYAEIDRFDGGFGWISHPDEAMQRASHAITSGSEVFLVDPLDANGLDELLDDAGELGGIVVLLDRHGRDTEILAERYDIPVYTPPSIDIDVGVPTHDFTDTLPGTSYELRRVVDFPGWHEAALTDGETLIVPEAVGTASFFRAGDEALGVHPALRLLPPKSLANTDPERVLVGHGEGVMANGGAALRDCLRTARRRAPRAYLEALGALI